VVDAATNRHSSVCSLTAVLILVGVHGLELATLDAERRDGSCHGADV
jgi:hypothetical protein